VFPSCLYCQSTAQIKGLIRGPQSAVMTGVTVNLLSVERAARKRREILEQMRKAIEAGDKESVLRLAKKLTGLNDEECHRTNSRVN
jgi:hypothetical protein